MSESLKFMKSRPAGISSRIRKVRGPRSIWVAENGLEVELPVIVDHLNMAPTGDLVWLVEARVELVHEKPEITRVNLAGNPNLVTLSTCSDFSDGLHRWKSCVSCYLT